MSVLTDVMVQTYLLLTLIGVGLVAFVAACLHVTRVSLRLGHYEEPGRRALMEQEGREGRR